MFQSATRLISCCELFALLHPALDFQVLPVPLCSAHVGLLYSPTMAASAQPLTSEKVLMFPNALATSWSENKTSKAPSRRVAFEARKLSMPRPWRVIRVIQTAMNAIMLAKPKRFWRNSCSGSWWSSVLRVCATLLSACMAVRCFVLGPGSREAGGGQKKHALIDTMIGSQQMVAYLMTVAPYFTMLPTTSAFNSSKINTIGFFSFSLFPFFWSS
mmetsp:Transcript_8217/g.19279  ORF Transcript_8217/g.19279 Transcript_8217/m.19279 type:complete len:215 (+) Transcript_8217:2765-3409(+)